MNAIPIPLKRSRILSALLRGDKAADGAARRGGGAVVAPRGRCRFHFFRAPAGLTRAQAARAARAYAFTHAPFADSRQLLLRAPRGVEIWWWDNTLPDGAKARGPESVYRAQGPDGWRIVVCSEGFEAQYWSDGGLIASAWRRTQFTKQQWAAFALGVDAARIAAPENPPVTLELPLLSAAHWRKRELRPPFTWRDGQNLALTFALCAAVTGAFFVGESLRLNSFRRDYLAERTRLDRQSAADARVARLGEYLRVTEDYQRLAPRIDPLALAADAFAVMRQFDISVRDWRVDQDGFEMSLDASINDVPLRDIVGALEAIPSLCGVEPNLSSEPGQLELTASIESDGACTVASRGQR